MLKLKGKEKELIRVIRRMQETLSSRKETTCEFRETRRNGGRRSRVFRRKISKITIALAEIGDAIFLE